MKAKRKRQSAAFKAKVGFEARFGANGHFSLQTNLRTFPAKNPLHFCPHKYHHNIQLKAKGG